MTYCWKCLKEGKKRTWPLYQVGVAWIFACKEHRDLIPDNDAFSLEREKETYETN